MKLPTIRNEFGEPMRVSDKMREKLVECLLSDRGLVSYNSLAPDREDVAEERTIHACEERGLLRFARRRGGHFAYAFALTPLGRKFAVMLVNERLTKLEAVLEASNIDQSQAAALRGAVQMTGKFPTVFAVPAPRMVS
jgi:hypothetical protein